MANPPESPKAACCALFTHRGRDKPDEVRNVVLIVCTLIAAVTFQAGVNPPGGVWQDNSKGHIAGQAIYASQSNPFYVFLSFNTVALSSSICGIICQLWGFPYFLEVVVATIGMVVTYGAAIFAVTPQSPSQFRWLLFLGAAPFLVRLVIQLGKWTGFVFANSTTSDSQL